MSGVNPFNFASWNLGGLNWNAWGEPNEVGLDDAPPVTTTPPPPPPPPAQATDTVTIGSNFTFNLGSYQPPNGWSQSDIVDIGALVWDDEFIQDLNLQDPMFWLGSGDMFPEGRHRDLTEEQATAIDYQTYTTSLAKDLGVSWPKYQSEVESARQEFQNSNVQSHHQGGSYFFSLEPSARVTSYNANPIIEHNENRQAANNLNKQLNDLRNSSKEDFFKLVQQLEANGYRVQAHKFGGANDRNPNDSVSEVYQRRYYTLNGRILTGIGNANGAYPLGGADGFQAIENTPYFSVPINNPALAQLGIESFEVSKNTIKHITNRHFSGLPGQSQFAADLKTETALVSFVIAPVLQNAYALDIRTNSKDSRGAIMINVYGNLPFEAGTDRNGAFTKSAMVSMRWVPGSKSAQVTTAFPVTQGRGN